MSVVKSTPALALETPDTLTQSITLGQIQFEHADLFSSKAVLRNLIKDPARQTTLVGFINPHVFNIACQNDDVNKFIKNCRLCCIDGIGVQLSALLLRRQRTTRIVAEELFNAMLLDDSFQCTATLIGVTDDELLLATDAINRRSRSITVTHSINGFKSASEYRHWFKTQHQADLILIGAGSPKSEQIALLAKQVCNRTVIWHIGAGTIKTWSGTKRRAPAWVSRIGVQWLHRICFEPHTRSRYFSGALRFVKHLSGTSR